MMQYNLIDAMPPSLIWEPQWPVAAIIIGLLIAQRLGELVYAKRNTKALLARGAQEYGRSHYPLMVAIHTAFLAALVYETLPNWPIIWPLAILFLVLQAMRLWVLATLGPYWTTRIISSPDFPRISSGPFRFIPHPNYLVVTLEIATIPLIFGHVWISVIFSLLNAAILFVRIRIEADILTERQAG
ncbi:isoprenylcysteine carboxyl methyltransferase family protein [Alterisphingorhabdus coralli]|uniref:Isoprenylcysteine carboxylmethyltransferase family protein n=1 Tax=Alterisphingorhabdus coralli TaxID=3071408 RepID=A0AA97F4A2_9SPHN|nr:isoprenylcysteine carboxylmethyltransferase family protein [Parasphingorhabdus sp. SCSIO 66989]WOE73768.1 isoprenylcysteine carboxylmethyltransferase family protein [Parasphingorhabdus sp. SCSIO 66989]